MIKKIYQLIIFINLLLILTISTSAKHIENVSVSYSERTSLLGSPKSWMMGPTTGFPTMFGWRVERFWKGEAEELPRWLAGVDLGIVIANGRLSIERRLRDGPFYTGLGGRILCFPSFDSCFYSLSIPISYRSGGGLGKWAAHISLSAEVFTFDFKEWQVLPALQISFLNKL
jgi:hypothetical protein